MINEKTFALSHQSFWLGATPMLPQFIRLQNFHSERFFEPFTFTTENNRGLIGELTFRIFAASYKRSCNTKELQDFEVQSCVDQSINFIQRFRALSRLPALETSTEGINEASQLATVLLDFFNSEKKALQLWPKFPGCGWLDSVEGDGLGGSTLYEIKCGKSRIRGKDIKQILCYLSLNYASDAYDINQICIFNPRRGLALRCTVESLCQEISGTPSPVLLGEIVEYISEPSWVAEGV